MGFLKNYRVDLGREQALCEANFVALRRLLGEAERGATLVFDVAMPNRPVHYTVSFEVRERSAHTAIVAVSADQYLSKWLHDLDFEVGMYFDAAMAEVVKFNGQRRLKLFIGDGRRVDSEDEKHQVNQFLAEWLAYCVKYGLAQEVPLGSA